MAIDPKFPGSPPLQPGSRVIGVAHPDSDTLPDPVGTQERPEDWNEPPGADDLGFDPESADPEDPEVDPLHPASTENDPVSR